MFVTRRVLYTVITSTLHSRWFTSLPKVLITRKIPKPALEIITTSKLCDVDIWDSEDPIPKQELIKRAQGKHGLYVTVTDKVDAELLNCTGSQLKVVSTMSVGYDHVSTSELKKRGILLGYTPDVLTDATATLTVGLLLATSRRLIESAAEVKNGGWSSWNPLWMCGSTLMGSTVGIVGLGRIGLAVAKRLVPFGVSRILYSGQTVKKQGEAEVNAEFVHINTLLEESDFVISCAALNSETHEMFNQNAFFKMKPTATFINTSRGGLVNQDDLYDALMSGQIKAAGLDVTVPEPLPTNHKLLSLRNCVVLPHIGSAEEGTRLDMARLASANLLAGIKGEKLPSQAQL